MIFITTFLKGLEIAGHQRSIVLLIITGSCIMCFSVIIKSVTRLSYGWHKIRVNSPVLLVSVGLFWFEIFAAVRLVKLQPLHFMFLHKQPLRNVLRRRYSKNFREIHKKIPVVETVLVNLQTKDKNLHRKTYFLRTVQDSCFYYEEH